GWVRRPRRGAGDSGAVVAARMPARAGDRRAERPRVGEEKLAVDPYLNPRRTPGLEDDKLRFVRLRGNGFLVARSGAGRRSAQRGRWSPPRDRHRRCRCAVGSAEAAQRPLTGGHVITRRAGTRSRRASWVSAEGEGSFIWTSTWLDRASGRAVPRYEL